MSYFKNRATLGDWVTYCDLCGSPCKASEAGYKSAGRNDNSLWLCKKRCYDKYVVNPQHLYPTPSIGDPKPVPLTRPGFDEDFESTFPPYNPPGD